MISTESRQPETVVGPTDRSFGLTFSAIFALLGLVPLWTRGSARAWALVVSAMLLALSVIWPRALAPANRLWLRIGLLLHRVVNPVVMAVLFYLIITPFGLVMRLFGAGLAPRVRRDATARTYWIVRDDAASRMDQQF